MAWGLLALLVRREVRQIQPSVERITWILICSILALVLTGVAVMVKVSSTPSLRWAP